MMLITLFLTTQLPWVTMEPLLNLTVDFFLAKNTPFVTAFVCNNETSQLMKSFADVGIRSNFIEPKSVTSLDLLNEGLSYPTGRMCGVLLDMTCPNSAILLQIASENRLFDISRHWFIILKNQFTVEEFDKISSAFQPQMFDIAEYLEFRNSEMELGSIMRDFNREVNYQLMEHPDLPQITAAKNITIEYDEKNEIHVLVNLKAMVDSELIIALPYKLAVGFKLYEIHRKTYFTRMLINRAGRVTSENGQVSVILDVPTSPSSVLRRRDFNGTLMRATSALMFYEYYSRSTDLSRKLIDQWATKSLQISQIAEQHFNFKMVIKCFDQYGWAINGGRDGFTGMLQHLAEQRTDMMSGGMLLITSRMNGVQYITNFWNVRMGLLFKQPSLSQVSNIFILPFSKGVWLSAALLLVVSAIIMYYQFSTVKNWEGRTAAVESSDVITFLTGAACQQGTELDTVNISARITMFVYLTSSIFLFTSYTANIVSLLQSSSNTIKTIQDFTESALEMGVENLPYEVNLIEEDNDPVIRELFNTKIAENKLAGSAYYNCTIGMGKVRNELYAFHAELASSARVISDTYLETEKCRLKLLTLFPYRFNGHGVPKKSPYWELLAQGYRWYDETGFVKRADRRFSYSLPKCAAGANGGYNSIAISDIDSIFILLIYGLISSFLLCVVENFYFYARLRSKATSSKINKITKKQLLHNQMVYFN